MEYMKAEYRKEGTKTVSIPSSSICCGRANRASPEKNASMELSTIHGCSSHAPLDTRDQSHFHSTHSSIQKGRRAN